MQVYIIGIYVFLGFVVSHDACAQNIYELRKLSEKDWLAMSTEERLRAIGTANSQAGNQTFLGNFGQFNSMSRKWGYNFYEMNDSYQNYSFRGFENYNVLEERRMKWSYNEFGDRISKMRPTSATVWKETYIGDGTFHVTMPGDYINSVSRGSVDGVWVAREATDDWAVSVVGAGALRTKYTPLTLNIPNINGTRVDFQSANNTVSLVSSALINSYEYGGVLLRGGTIRRNFGVLTLGATYVNEYVVQGSREKGDSWSGTITNYTPVPLVVTIRILDDSPDDATAGPIVYGIRLKVNGKYRDDIIPRIIHDDIIRDKTTANIKNNELGYLRSTSEAGSGKPNQDNVSLNETLPKYADYFYFFDYQKGSNISNVSKNYNTTLAQDYFQFLDPGSSSIQVNGTEAVVYWFDISAIKEYVNRVEAEVTVANDYRIQTAMVYTREISGGHDTTGKIVTFYNSTYWNTVAQAEGNIKDRSNLKTIDVDFGFQVASLIYGFDAGFNLRGFKVNGEFVTNSNHFMFPDGIAGSGEPEYGAVGQAPRTGHKWAVLDHAYYITAQKDWTRIGFTGEIFKMGKFYKPWLDHYISRNQKGGYDSRNSLVRMPLIEDNDDGDMYPDTMYVNRSMGSHISSYEDPDGVFPGNDEDHDGIADNNKNNNDIADYNEPFLMFDSDPDEFVFGNDYNNNTIPDFREDDMKYDTPYDLDRKGYHFSLRYSPVTSVNLTGGSFRTGSVGLSTRTDDDYMKINVNYDVFSIGTLYAEYRYEIIQDNIRDIYVQVGNKFRQNYLLPGISTTIGRFDRDVYYDELEYKDSVVSRFFMSSMIRALPSITMENHVKFEHNHRIEGTMYDSTYQPGETISTLAIVNKLVYTKQLGNWVFSPGIKMRFYKKDHSGTARPGDYYTTRIPLVMLKYVVSPRTRITFGFEGIPGFEFHHRDYVQEENSYHLKTYMWVFENQTTYFGYKIWASTGVKYNELVFKGLREFESYKSSVLFVSINLGW
ncbi:hypothetical protein LLG96_01940 [bacterium]|nr:hypothetical protein [bacterium]